MKADYITIKEYADIRNVSVSAVYKRLNKSLQPYLEVVEGQKMLKRTVLEDEGLIEVSTPVEETASTPLQPSSTLLEEQLREKDKQIEALNEQVKELRESNKNKDEFIQEQSRKLTELLEQSNILLQNNQILLAQPEAQKESAVVSAMEDVEAEQITKEKPEKKSWFSGLFGNK